MKSLCIFALFAIVFPFYSSAQFLDDSLQTCFVCNASGNQSNVSAFGDGDGGTYSFWIDHRQGINDGCIYAQHLDSLGNEFWQNNGKLLYHANNKKIWNMKATPWRNGILLAWVEGTNGGDTLLCDYYNFNGHSNWNHPEVISYKDSSVLYVGYNNLDILPNDTGATVAYNLTVLGGSTYFSFNQIDQNGRLRWLINSNLYSGNGYYYSTADDHHNGFYVTASGGGPGATITIGHFDIDGNLTTPGPVDLTSIGGGRGNDEWKLACDDDSNAYITWVNNPGGNVILVKIQPDGTLPFSSGGVQMVCDITSGNINPDIFIAYDTIYVTWADPRNQLPGGYQVYMQKFDANGNAQWNYGGIQVSPFTGSLPFPKVTVAGNDVVAFFLAGGAFRSQRVFPNGGLQWPYYGIAMNMVDIPYLGDYRLVPAGDGAVTAIWAEASGDICAGRMRLNGTLTNILQHHALSLSAYPNPASSSIRISSNNFSGHFSTLLIYDYDGRLAYREENFTGDFSVNVDAFSSGLYCADINGEKIKFSVSH